MTLILSEKLVQGLLSMREVVPAVEECFKQQSSSRAFNSPRTKTSAPGSTLSAMHASLPYLGRAGVKCYLSSKRGTKFVFVLFRLADGEPLLFMGADLLGRFRTGAASAVATRHLFRKRSFRFALAGSGRQALTQVLAMKEVAELETVRIWSPKRSHLSSFVKALSRTGIEAQATGTLAEAFAPSDVATTITTSREPFVDRASLRRVSHVNACGSNTPDRSEITPEAIARFQTVVVDDKEQSKAESGDLIIAQRRGLFSWDKAVELKDVVSGRVRATGKTFFKSNGVALEDVAVASMLYDKALKSGEYSDYEREVVDLSVVD